MKKILLFLMLSAPIIALSQTLTKEVVSQDNNVFPIITDQHKATILYDNNDYTVVKKVAELFRNDIRMVTGHHLEMSDQHNHQPFPIIIGSIDRNEFIQRLAKEKKINILSLINKWEKYLIQTVNNPTKGVKKALIIAGSDRRGTAYGVFHISELIGVNPWYWWADAPIKKHPRLCLNVPTTYSKSPSVKYRGIFINDEDWGLQPWASKNFEKEIGNIGPRTYAKVCELLLRLKANYLCPAMHPVSIPFKKKKKNKLVADSFGIVMGSSHCEPLLLNTAKEWNKETMGPWDYDKNREGILKVLGARIKNNAPYENVWTLALRGLHDAAMGVGVPMKEKVKMLQKALIDQRNLLAKNIDKPIEEIPQAFTPYKEVLDIYSNGLELPEDITIIWPDDNYGYMKRLSGPIEQKRSGRSGVYYHVSYLGVPQSYLWFSTTPTALMYEELHKAYATTADRIWLVNCGDIKGCEPQISFFLDLAYDIDRFNQENAWIYQAQWLSNIFGNQYYNSFKEITTNLSNLAFLRKPEYMGWGFWNNHWGGGGEKRTDTEFSFSNYNEAENRLNKYQHLGTLAEKLLKEMPEKSKAAMFELVYYPTKGAELMNKMILDGQLYRKYVIQHRTQNEVVKKNAELMHDSLELITDQYNALKNGKWKYIMSLRQNYDGDSHYFELPIMDTKYIPLHKAQLAIETESDEPLKGKTAIHILPTFNTYNHKNHWIDIYNQGKEALKWFASSNYKWIKLSKKNGNTKYSDRIIVSIDWDKIPSYEQTDGIILIQSGQQSEKVLVSVFNPASATFRNTYIEENGVVSIPAIGFQRKYENNDIKMFKVPGLGYEGESLQIGDPTAPLQMYRSPKDARIEYDFYTFNYGMVDVYTYVLPTFPLNTDRDFKLPEHTNSDTKYSVCIDGGNIATPSTSSIEYSQTWYESVLRNCRVNKSTLYIDKPGRHTLQIRCGDPGTILQKIIIDLGGMKKSYAGPTTMPIFK